MTDQNTSGRPQAGTPRSAGGPGSSWRGSGVPGPPEFPGPREPGRAPFPGPPEFPRPQRPAWEPGPGTPGPDPAQPTRIWLDPPAGPPDPLYERLLQRRIVLAAGFLDDAAATRLSAQLLTLDAEGGGPVRLELQNLRADLPAALTLMGVLDVVRVEITAYAGGETAGAALGVLASCPRRLAYPNASFMVSEPRMQYDGTVTAVTAREEQAKRMTDSLYYRLAEAAGRDADDIREDARRGRVLTVAEAIGYGLVHDRAAARRPRPPGPSRP
jgi:ATP-dependent Clp protease protease subunit